MINWISDKFISIQKRYPATPYIYSLVANAAIAIMQCASKFLGSTMSTNFILYLRATILIFFHTFILTASGGQSYVKKRQVLILLIVRTLLSAVGLMFNFYSITYISLSVVNSVWMTGPIWTNFIEAVYLKTKIQPANIGIAFVCLFGLLLITKPSFLFTQQPNPNLIFYSLLTLLGTIFVSFSQVISRKLRTEITNLQNLQYFYYGQIMLNAMVILGQGEKGAEVHGFDWGALGFIVLLVCAAYVAQLCTIRSLYLKSASEVGLFAYSLIVMALVFDFLLFDEELDWLSIVGVGVICSSLLIILTR